MHSENDYKADPFLAVDAVGALLRAGCLNLFLGAGVSAGFGLPYWRLLVARILGRGDDAVFIESLRDKSDRDMGRLIDDVDNGKVDYISRVYGALYDDISETLVDQLQRSPLLLAVAALTTGTSRGRIQHVFTYNYDDLLEQYLNMLGYIVRIRTGHSDYSYKSDVEINHVHGFLPQSWTVDSKLPDLVLSERSYRGRRSGIDEEWSSYVEHSLYSKAALLLGLSGDDSGTLDIFERAKKRVRRSDDYNGYWLLTPDAYLRNAQPIREVGMCPISIEKEQLPTFIFRACQAASGMPKAKRQREVFVPVPRKSSAGERLGDDKKESPTSE